MGFQSMWISHDQPHLALAGRISQFYPAAPDASADYVICGNLFALARAPHKFRSSRMDFGAYLSAGVHLSHAEPTDGRVLSKKRLYSYLVSLFSCIAWSIALE